MFLYRADYLKYDFIPMNKRIRRVYGQNLNDTVCVVDPVMRGLGAVSYTHLHLPEQDLLQRPVPRQQLRRVQFSVGQIRCV